MKLRALSYNIHKGYNWRNNRFILGQIKGAIDELEADVCLLQEVMGSGLHGHLTASMPTENQFEFLADTIWHHYRYGQNAAFPNRHHGNATLSKFPIVEYENTDISTNRLEKRGLLYCKMGLPGGRFLHTFNTHLNLFERSRLRQTDFICGAIERHLGSDEPCLIAGDFNDWTGSTSRLLQERLGFHQVHFQGRSRVATFPSFLPVLFLDRIFYRGMNLTQCGILNHAPWPALSDHLPLMAEFEFPA